MMLLFCMDIHISLVFVLDRLLFQFLNVFYLNRSTATVPINACTVMCIRLTDCNWNVIQILIQLCVWNSKISVWILMFPKINSFILCSGTYLSTPLWACLKFPELWLYVTQTHILLNANEALIENYVRFRKPKRSHFVANCQFSTKMSMGKANLVFDNF